MQVSSHRRPLLLGAAAVAVGGTLALALCAGTAGASSSPTGTLQLVATGTGGGSVDNAPKGPSLGDQFFESGRVADAGSGRTVGTFTVTGELVGGTTSNGLEQSETVVYLAGGTIVLDGGHPTQDDFSLPVVGGTGKYVGASGVGNFAPGPNGKQRATIVLRG